MVIAVAAVSSGPRFADKDTVMTEKCGDGHLTRPWLGPAWISSELELLGQQTADDRFACCRAELVLEDDIDRDKVKIGF